MTNAPELQMLGWLIFAWGAALIVMSWRQRPKKEMVHSPTRRIAGALSGLVFCLLASILIWAETPTTRNVLLAAAVVAGGTSWYLGRHAKKMDRAMR